MPPRRTTKEPRLAPTHPFAPVLEALVTQKQTYELTEPQQGEDYVRGRIEGIESAITIVTRFGAKMLPSNGSSIITPAPPPPPEGTSLRLRLEMIEARLYKLETGRTRQLPSILDEKPGKINIATATLRKKVGIKPSKEFDGLARGERHVLIAIVQHPDGLTRNDITAITGYKRQTRDAYIARLPEGAITKNDEGKLVATDDGRKLLGSSYEPHSMGDALRRRWCAGLPQGERAVLEAVAAAWPKTLTRVRIGELTGYKRQTRDAYISRVARRHLITTSKAGVRAVDLLFDYT